MHDTAVTQVQTEGYLPQITPSSPSLAQHLVELLQHVMAQSARDVSVAAKRPRGRPATLSLQHLWLALLIGVIRHHQHLSTIWRTLCLEAMGSFSPVRLTYEAVRKRLLKAGPDALEHLFETVSHGLAQWSQQQPSPSALSLAPFAPQVVALDESTLDGLRRLTSDLRDLPPGDAHLLPGKLAGLFDLRAQRWVRLQFRADVLAHCSTSLLLLLDGLAPGSLILADLGYFSFAWFDYLTGQGYFWVSRLKAGVTYEIQQVLAFDDHTGMLDALVWLGKYRADRAAHAVRLVCFCLNGSQYCYLTNVLSPTQLSLHDLAQLYARRWDIELAFKLLKCELGLHLWWGARAELVLIQLWIALILAQLLHALQLHLALQAEVEPFEVSMHLLVELLGIIPAGPTPVLERLVQEGRTLGLIRPSTRLTIVVPTPSSSALAPVPRLKDLKRHARYAQRNAHPRPAPFVSHFLTRLLI